MELFVNYTFPALVQVGVRRLIAINLPGYGRSSLLPRHTFLAYKKTLKDFLQAKRISQCHLLGESMGGSVVLSFAADYPEKVLSVCANGAVYNGSRQFHWLWRKVFRVLAGASRILPKVVDQWFSWIRTHPRTQGLGGRLLNPVDLMLLDNLGDGNYREIAHRLGRISSNRAYWENLVSAGQLDITKDLPKITVPTLISDGKETVLRSIRSLPEVAQLISSQIRFTAEVSPAGHLAPYSNPDAFAKIFSEFIKRHSS